MYTAANPPRYRSSKETYQSNTPQSSKRTKQLDNSSSRNQPDKSRDYSPSTTLNNSNKKPLGYQNLLQRIALANKKTQNLNDPKQLYINKDNSTGTSRSKTPLTPTQNHIKYSDRENFNSQSKAGINDKNSSREMRNTNIQDLSKVDRSGFIAKASRPSSSNHTSQRGYSSATKNPLTTTTVSGLTPKTINYKKELEKVMNFMPKDIKKSRDSSPSFMKTGREPSETRTKDLLDSKRTQNKKVILDLEEDYGSKTIDNVIAPMTTNNNSAQIRYNSCLKGTKTGKASYIPKHYQPLLLPKSSPTRNSSQPHYRALNYSSANNTSNVAGKESFTQAVTKVSTPLNPKQMMQGDLNTQRQNHLDFSHMQPQSILPKKNLVTVDANDYSKKTIKEQLEARNLNILSTKDSTKPIDIASFVKNYKSNKRIEEKPNLSIDSYGSQIPNEDVQIQELPATNRIEKSNRTKKEAEIMRNISPNRRETMDGLFITPRGLKRIKNFSKENGASFENIPKTTDRSANTKALALNDIIEIEDVIKKIEESPGLSSKKFIRNPEEFKEENNNYSSNKLKTLKEYNTDNERYKNYAQIEKPDFIKFELLSPKEEDQKNNSQTHTKHQNNQAQATPSDEISILSLSSEEKEAKRAIFKQEYLIGKEVGRGAYAAVRIGVHKPSNMKVAIKVYEKTRIADPMRKKSVRREIKVMQRISHPNIVRIHDIYETRNYLNIVMEYVGGKSLYEFLKAQPNRRLKEKNAFKIFQQLVGGINYCHARCITHRDIKLENILLDKSGVVKIIDFGFTTCIPNDKKVKMFCGTPSYMAPEIVLKKEYCGPPVDIWALGVLLYALLFGDFPFRGSTDKELWKAVAKGEFKVPDYVSQEVTSLLKKMLDVDPDKRPTSKEIMGDPWFVYNSFMEEKKEIKHRRCLSAEKTRKGQYNINTDITYNNIGEIQANHEGFINLNQFTTGTTKPPLFCAKKAEEKTGLLDTVGSKTTKNKPNDIAQKKRSQTPTDYHYRNKHFTFEDNENIKVNFSRNNSGDFRDKEMNFEDLLRGENTYDETKGLKKTFNEIEIWNSNLGASEKSGKKDYSRNSVLNKTIGVLNKSERKDDTFFRCEPEIINKMIKMGHTEEEIIRGLKEKTGIVYAVYTWLKKEQEISQSSNIIDSMDSESQTARKPSYGFILSNHASKKNISGQGVTYASSHHSNAKPTINFSQLNSSNLAKLNATLDKEVQELNAQWLLNFGYNS